MVDYRKTKGAFQPQRTEEEREQDKSKVMTVRLNIEDQKILKTLQRAFDVQSDGTMLKICLHQFNHVLHGLLAPRYFMYLFKKERDRLSHYEDIGELFK